MLDFTAIDFETANKYANSACSLAAVTMHDNECVRQAYTLIKPPFLRFDPMNVRIHGITEDQVLHKPTFDQLWERIRTHLEGRIVIAHYAVFDMRVLRSMLKTYGLERPRMQYACTVQISQRVWPELANHKLDTMADFLGLTFQHHQALDDARVCAAIACAAADKVGAASFAELLTAIGLSLKDF
jgi:DNA polymerase-3 subunit epsilon